MATAQDTYTADLHLIHTPDLSNDKRRRRSQDLTVSERHGVEAHTSSDILRDKMSELRETSYSKNN